jgi:hypothetical protein
MFRWRLFLAALALLLTSSTTTRTADQTLIAPGSSWKYNDLGTNLGTAWKERVYNDTSWASGNAQLGYGDGDESTVINYGSSSNKRITYYFRRSFTVADPDAYSALSARFVRDDGAVIYLNGNELYRENMPTGTIQATTTALADGGSSEEPIYFKRLLPPTGLLPGTNVLAAEIHLFRTNSYDLSFDQSRKFFEYVFAHPCSFFEKGSTHKVGRTPFVPRTS